MQETIVTISQVVVAICSVIALWVKYARPETEPHRTNWTNKNKQMAASAVLWLVFAWYLYSFVSEATSQEPLTRASVALMVIWGCCMSIILTVWFVERISAVMALMTKELENKLDKL